MASPVTLAGRYGTVGGKDVTCRGVDVIDGNEDGVMAHRILTIWARLRATGRLVVE